MEPNYNHFYDVSEPVAYSNQPMGQESLWQRIQRLIKQHFILIILASFISVGAFLSILNIYKTSKVYQKPDAWVISQGLNSTLTKQQLLLKRAKGGKVTLGDLAKVATASTTVKPEAVKIGNDYLLSTGADGKVAVDIDPGQYRVEIIKIERIDFTGVPVMINIERGSNILNIGLTKGSGKVTSVASHPVPDTGSINIDSRFRGNDNIARMTVSLFQDKNGNGKKEDSEPDLPWAGITIKLTKT